ncbi:hypothetical protein M422DRAFT_74935 [Sphaerobolus stellatus SS14]|uniref:Carboxypeptidase n=1 Tax=Sphaerobolus stellatus (strain SS14) TaxID=990650 RepID=A0A0C9VTF2_SPHS4|nr:hypothetical protein M422DRAFT_74935 [Sphaerobolus stellatus SS14]
MLYLLSFILIAMIGIQARQITPAEVKARQRRAYEKLLEARIPTPPITSTGIKNITFSNPKASEFWVDGTAIPEVDFDIGPSWAGLLPISGAQNETRELFFWFFPPAAQGSLDDLIFWTNGGPGCSSLEGLLQENGPFSWSWGTGAPIVNQFSWTNLSSIIYIEQPVGTGFSRGTPNIKNEDDLAAQLVGFLQQFLEVFSELKGKKFYIAGESYAGMYVPYIANFIFENPGMLDLNLQGTWISDPSITTNVVSQNIPALNFVNKYENVFALNSSFKQTLQATAESCGYADYMETFVTYPPTGPLPLPGNTTTVSRNCGIWRMIFNAALLINPAFNEYRIFDTFPILWDVLGFPGSFEDIQVSPIYFDRLDVKQAIHAPTDVAWTECSNVRVFPQGDASQPSSFTVLPNVIEKSRRSVIVHGLADFILMSDGSRIAIQNMTWGGMQGFQTPIQTESFVVDGMGVMGNMHNERGLTYYEVALSGHMIPQFSPKSAFQIMQYLMGFRETP